VTVAAGRHGPRDHARVDGTRAHGSALAIVVGSVQGGIPESFVARAHCAAGGISVALLLGGLLSYLPEGMSSSSGLGVAGWPRGREGVYTGSLVAIGFAVSLSLSAI